MRKSQGLGVIFVVVLVVAAESQAGPFFRGGGHNVHKLPTRYSPLHYWSPRLWNLKAFHRGYHLRIGYDYHFPVVHSASPIASPMAEEEMNTTPERLPHPKEEPPNKIPILPERIPKPEELKGPILYPANYFQDPTGNFPSLGSSVTNTH